MSIGEPFSFLFYYELGNFHNPVLFPNIPRPLVSMIINIFSFKADMIDWLAYGGRGIHDFSLVSNLKSSI